MIKMLQVPVTLLLIFSLMGCGTANNDDENNDKTDNRTETNTNDNANNDKASNSGNTNDKEGNTASEQQVNVSDETADDVETVEGVENAYVLVTDTNAYVAVELKEGIDETEQLESKIAEQVRKGNQEFENVYVSANPDFVKQMNDYGNKIREGKPVEGFFEEFTDAVQRVFPDAQFSPPPQTLG
jgi:spore cortex protein